MIRKTWHYYFVFKIPKLTFSKSLYSCSADSDDINSISLYLIFIIKDPLLLVIIFMLFINLNLISYYLFNNNERFSFLMFVFMNWKKMKTIKNLCRWDIIKNQIYYYDEWQDKRIKNRKNELNINFRESWSKCWISSTITIRIYFYIRLKLIYKILTIKGKRL